MKAGPIVFLGAMLALAAIVQCQEALSLPPDDDGSMEDGMTALELELGRKLMGHNNHHHNIKHKKKKHHVHVHGIHKPSKGHGFKFPHNDRFKFKRCYWEGKYYPHNYWYECHGHDCDWTWYKCCNGKWSFGGDFLDRHAKCF
jgi:hypothetical protein